MNLKHFTEKALTGGKSKIAYISIGKAGGFYLSKFAIKMLGLSDTGKVLFFQDQYDPKKWYVAKSKTEEGYNIRIYKDNRSNTIQSKALRSKLIESYSHVSDLEYATSFKVRICHTPVEYEGLEIYEMFSSSVKPKD